MARPERRRRSGAMVGFRGVAPVSLVVVEAGGHWSGWTRGGNPLGGDLVTIAQFAGEPAGVFVARVRVALHRLELRGASIGQATLVLGNRIGVEIVTARLLLALAIALRFRSQRTGTIVIEGPGTASQRSVAALLEVVASEVEGTGVSVREGVLDDEQGLESAV